nr:ATP-binding protein [Bacteroidota bacterium]
MYLKRHIDSELLAWKESPKKKPILLRGARQVGKTESVRNLAKQFENYLEINFEENQKIHSVFSGDLSPVQISENLSAVFNVSIKPGKTLLFFDEIQACIPAIRSIRFFYEKMPELHVIAAGSLLEFALAEIPSFGVGRIRSMYMYPMSFDEFLKGCGEDILLTKMKNASPGNPLHQAVHEKLLSYLNKFLILGGMPEVISTYIQTKEINTCMQIQDDLIFSLNDDFAKYKKRVPVSRLRDVFKAVVKQAGSKFIFSNVSGEPKYKLVKEALELLIMAGLAIPVVHTAGNGIPLGAEANSKRQKILLYDTGIFMRISNLNIGDLLLSQNFNIINKGNLAEQFAGLELLKSTSCYQPGGLYYWHREAKSSNAEIDYLVTRGSEIIPIEVKAGTKGAMQSMYLFLNEKHRNMGIRVSNENFSHYSNIDVYPLYAVSNIISKN